jgi:high-affinity nickel permease
MIAASFRETALSQIPGVRGLKPFVLLGIALALGLRHAADPDHVVAITAIAARTRRILPALWLGIVWGIGHAISLLSVGVGIILFNLQVYSVLFGTWLLYQIGWHGSPLRMSHHV